MKLNKLNESIKKLLCETLEDEASSIVSDYLPYLHDVLDYDDLSQISDELAEQLDCVVYGDSGKDNLVINVKNRPYITNRDVIDYLNTDSGADEYLMQIDLFARDLEQQYYDDFVIVGAQGGYWGLYDCNSHIQVSKQGFDELVSKVLELTKDTYKDEIGGTEIAEIMSENYKDLFMELLDDTNNFEFDSEYVNKIKDIRQQINDKEQQMNNLEYWK